ncbi:hypothetical protein RSAG8_07326, partial [Rhizoctonia solani AG-8 WAC10335]
MSPPEPPELVNWDQNIPYDVPAGRWHHAKWQVLLMGLIHEAIFKLLSQHSVHDPLPPPPPPSLQSIFNQLAANIVAQMISIKQPSMLTVEEIEELPSTITSHNVVVSGLKNDNFLQLAFRSWIDSQSTWGNIII